MLDHIETIGHSTRTAEEFTALLRHHYIERLVDVRRFPGSRRYPHFDGDALAAALGAIGGIYEHLPELGGRRSTSRGSINGGLRNAAFRGYADYMQTAEFAAAVDQLLNHDRRTAIMCAEAVPWRCHRNLIADELLRRGVTVRHIISDAEPHAHELHRDARLGRSSVFYPEPDEQGKLFR